MDVMIGNQRVTLNTTLGSPGGQATVFEIPNDPQRAAKIYHPEWRTAEQDAKNKYLLAHPLATSPGVHSMAHVRGQIFDPASGEALGIVIDRVRDSVDLSHIVANSHVGMAFKLQVGLSLAASVCDIHSAGHARGDISLTNDLVDRFGRTTAIDVDSLQINANGVSMRCGTGVMEFQAPEVQGTPLEDVDHTELHDRFAFAVLLFQLLMDGVHPFDCHYSGTGRRPPLIERIQTPGYFPYAPQPLPGISPKTGAPSYSSIPKEIRDYFQRCFVDGHSAPDLRPPLSEWVDLLRTLCPNSPVALSHSVWRNVLNPTQPVRAFTPNFARRHFSTRSRQKALVISGAVVAVALAGVLAILMPASPTSAPIAHPGNAHPFAMSPTMTPPTTVPPPASTPAMNPAPNAAVSSAPDADTTPVLPRPQQEDITPPPHKYRLSECVDRVGPTPGLWAILRDGKEIE